MSTQDLGGAPAPSRQTGFSVGTIVFGGVLVLLGLLWFLATLDVTGISYGAVLAVGLIAVGAGIVVTAQAGSHGGLIALGLILTAILTVATVVTVPLNGTWGDQNVSLSNAQDIKSEYSVTAGNLNLDLQRVTFPAGDTTVKTRVGVGNLTIDVPANVGVKVVYHVGVGQANVLGTSQSGGGMDKTVYSAGFDNAASRLILDVNLGVGNLEVNQ